MRKSRPWHHTPLGAAVLGLGSIRLAVPVLVFTAGALALGTYVDSTRGAQAARDVVYASWWFIGLMALVCVSLVFAVISRFPWNRRHIGFITVHAGLIMLIIGGFWSLFSRVEGLLALDEGMFGDVIETQESQVELVSHEAGKFTTIATAPGPRGPTTLTLGDVRVQVIERWENCRDEEHVDDSAPFPFRGVQLSPQQGVAATWVGEEEGGGGAPTIAGLKIRVLPDGAAWEPPAKESPGAAQGYEFVLGQQRYPLGDEGREAFPGWSVTSIKRYTRAMVAAEGLTELASGPENPAVDVTITDGQGATERHTAFLHFADLVMNRTVAGVARSNARLVPSSGAAANGGETLVIYGPISQTRIAYIGPDGTVLKFDEPAALPRTLDLGLRRVTIAQQYARARGGWRTVKAPRAAENRPALVIRVGDGTELAVMAWKGVAQVPSQDHNLMLRYGPRQVALPFAVRLTDFRKTDYPGTEMAMAYESDVAILRAGQPDESFRIYMNHPYTHGPWKVYQSGFVGDSTSVFSVMHDSGLPLTYVGCTVLCIGIVVTFYSRSLSWGHPGIPIGFSETEQPHATPQPSSGGLRADALAQPAGAGGV